ncbi:MAG: hypothetical protein OXC05_12920 [Halieaceae bacterium]|nr:hypothetical protein [Halieaceae bacterium]
MTRQVHFVGSIGLDTVEEVFSTVGRELGSKVQRCPDGEVGGRLPIFGAPDNVEEFLGERFARLAEAIPDAVELGFHLCYGDLDAKHFIEPTDTGKATAMVNLITRSIDHPVGWIHLPVPVDRDDLAYFEPLANLELGAETELFLGLVHAGDGVEGTRRRIAAAEQVVENFGIATECGIARVRTPELVRELLHIHALAAD